MDTKTVDFNTVLNIVSLQHALRVLIFLFFYYNGNICMYYMPLGLVYLDRTCKTVYSTDWAVRLFCAWNNNHYLIQKTLVSNSMHLKCISNIC